MKLPLLSAIALAISVPSFQPVSVLAQAQAVPAAVAACYAAPTICAVVGATAGGYIIIKYGQKQFCTWASCKPLQMMQDADNTSDEGWGVRAPNQQTAESKCQREAANRSEGAVVKCLGCRQVTQGTRTVDPRFVCTLRVER